ncbi:GDCCVxC domain-containing (seleno)protein [Oceanisphaera sp. KMM 10153]|uniref:GDCCVxC domain-containing (seleno)protein n=1 Tax=Oceanisphaera submarina TaxID=3390193 RepID=UPI0039762F1A
MKPELESMVTCPACGHQEAEVMPEGACQYYYQCKWCHALLKPKSGDCCIFCSYGDTPCPSVQSRKPGHNDG